MAEDIPAVLDGHNDTLLALLDREDPLADFADGYEEGHVDQVRAEAGAYGGGFFAMFVRNEDPDYTFEATEDGYEIPYAEAVDHDRALARTVEMLSLLYRLAASDATLEVTTTVSDIRRAIETDSLAAIPHIEGAAAVATDLSNLDFLYAAGVRSIGLTWSRPNAFGEGVPFKYPSDPDTGSGLTAAGWDLVERCNELGIVCDLAHLNAAGFWDVAEASTDPLVVSHTAVHALSPTSRNLTDEQIEAVAESGGLVGIQFGVENLRSDGMNDPDVPASRIAAHVEYVANLVGVEHVALGTDFDGCTVPDEVGDVTGLPLVMEELADRGFSSGDLEQIALENWLRVLDTTW